MKSIPCREHGFPVTPFEACPRCVVDWHTRHARDVVAGALVAAWHRAAADPTRPLVDAADLAVQILDALADEGYRLEVDS